MTNVSESYSGPGTSPRDIRRDGGVVLETRTPASFDPGGVVFEDVPGSKIDGRNADFVEVSVNNNGANIMRYQVLGAPVDVLAAYENLSGSTTVGVGVLDTYRATRDETTHRFFKVQVRRNAAGSPITYELREFAKGPG
jgi:hypothetical protein